MKTTMPPINSSDNLFHDGDPSVQRDGTLLTADHLNNVQASVIDLQNEMTNILSQTGKAPNNTSMQLAQGIVDLIDAKLTKLSLAIQFAISPTVPDATQSYHAVNLKQLQAAGGGGGANMSGVMNNFIGAVDWFNGTRARLPAGYIALDGQVLSRLAYPDLWAAVNSGLLNSQTDALWLNSGDSARPTQYRSCFSTGGAAGTAPGGVTPDAWFRVPDLNGITSNSIKHLFLAGSSGAASEPANGQIWSQSAPNIAGSVYTMTNNTDYANAAGSFSPGGQDAGSTTSTLSGPDRSDKISFSATLSNKTYGRGAQYQKADGSASAAGSPDNIGDLYPNHAVGIWIIRASGAFTAASTAFNVITGDATAPANGTTVAPGQIKALYQVAGADKYSATLTGTYKIGDSVAYAIVQAALTGGAYTNFYFGTDGEFSIGSQYKINMQTGAANLSSLVVANGVKNLSVYPTNASQNNYSALGNSTGNPTDGAFVSFASGGWYSDWWTAGGCRGGGVNLKSYKIQVTNANATGWWEFLHDASGRITTVAGTITPVASDRRLKEDITYAEKGALDRVNRIQARDFTWKCDGREDRGYVAQELAEIDPRYVFAGGGENPDDPILNVSQNALISDLIGAVQELTRQNKALQEEVAALKAK